MNDYESHYIQELYIFYQFQMLICSGLNIVFNMHFKHVSCEFAVADKSCLR